jgi:hypothetical protein
MMDIYFEYNYGKLYEPIENGTCELFEYRSSLGTIKHMFIKRKIPIHTGTEIFYDIVTPYGYGGPLIIECKEGQKSKLVREFYLMFKQYCKKNNIVSEFIRFHPVLNNAFDFMDCYDVVYTRRTIGTNLIDYDDPFRSEFTKSCRKNIRNALNKGVTYNITKNPKHLDNFVKIYYMTMRRNEAADYYYFDNNYFNRCAELLGSNMVLVEAIYQEKTIAMGIFFAYDKIINAHLSGTHTEFIHLSPAYILRYAITEWGKENGYYLIHHGGGKSNSSNDSLYLFKKQFGKNTEFEFYVGKKIWNDKVYKDLCLIVNADDKSDFFPSYRKGER